MFKDIKDSFKAISEQTKTTIKQEHSRKHGKSKNTTKFNYEALQKEVVEDLHWVYDLNEKQAIRVYETAYLEHEDRDAIKLKASILAEVVRYCLNNQA